VTPERVLSARELNRALLERQLLLERRRMPVARAVERVCALQAQYSPSPYIALWSRLENFRREQLERALERRDVVKATMMRVTLHMVSARDYPYFVAAWMPAAQEMTPGVTPKTLTRLSRRVRAAASKPVTYEEIEAIAAKQLNSRWRVRTLAPMLHLPPSGTWRYHGRVKLLVMREFLGVGLPSREEGAEHLVRRYLAAFGPATRTDVIRFAGMRTGDVRPGFERLRLRTFRDEQGRVLFDLPRAPLPATDTAAPPRFLAKWDHVLLGLDDRTRVLPRDLQSVVIRKNGDVLPSFLVDGVVAGLWTVERSKEKATMRLESFAPLPKQARRELVDEGERLLRWIEDDATSFTVR
jgi:hypothetical protein